MEHRYIQGYAPNYIIREDGAIFSRKGKLLSTFLNDRGYVCIKLSLNGKRKHHKVHRLVAQTFIPNPHPRKFKVVLHGDDDRTNTHKDNLSWGNASMNMKDMVRKGRGKNQFKPRKTNETTT